MKKCILIFFSLYSLSFANIYEKLNDFAYEKKPNKDFKIQEVKLVQFSQENKDCLELLIEVSQVRILNSYNSNIEFFIEEDKNILDIQKEFLNIFNIDDNIKALTLHLFLSMLPLHNDFKEKQMAFLANAFILYDKFFKESK